ncbi:MAG TPA: glycine zipper 2TM domain-containing protein [Gammaproteobacteria bacterium]|jgi:outer membrane lipoprotein SlyB
MKTLSALFAAILSISLIIGGCSSNASQPSDQYGVIKSINPTTESSSGINAGTVIGGVLGGLAGHQVGGGSGQTVATIGGAVGGAVIGTQVDRNSSSQMYKIGVRLNDGQFVTVNQKGSVADLRLGERVTIDNNGQVHPA